MVNARGGVNGGQIELVSLDDKNERKTAGANAKTLLESKNLVALFGFASATLSLDAIPQAEAKGVTFFAPFSGANPVRVNSPERSRMLPTSSLSFVGGDQYAKAVGEAGAGVSIAQVVPNPSSSIPVVRECAKALEAAGSKSAMNTTQLEACLGAKVLTEAIRRAKRPVNAKSVLEALTNFGSYELGGFTVEFNPTDHHGSSFVELARLSKDGRLLTR